MRAASRAQSFVQRKTFDTERGQTRRRHFCLDQRHVPYLATILGRDFHWHVLTPSNSTDPRLLTRGRRRSGHLRARRRIASMAADVSFNVRAECIKANRFFNRVESASSQTAITVDPFARLYFLIAMPSAAGPSNDETQPPNGVHRHSPIGGLLRKRSLLSLATP